MPEVAKPKFAPTVQIKDLKRHDYFEMDGNTYRFEGWFDSFGRPCCSFGIVNVFLIPSRLVLPVDPSHAG